MTEPAFTLCFELVVQGLLDHTNLTRHFGRPTTRIDQLRRRHLELLGVSRLRNPLHPSTPISPYFALPSVPENRKEGHYQVGLDVLVI
jgi:hypothetical protein